ncbi:MAG TPA: ROK family protein [Vicinamibacteria bacterium]|nr:ROK family protein [Vicinamibacteria bacterium]
MRFGVDVGGTKIEAIVLEGAAVRARCRVPSPRDDYEATLHAIADVVARMEREVGGQGRVGIGMPGALSPASGDVKNSNSAWLNGRPLAEDLGRLIPRPLRFANDANCFALSEAVDGAGAGARVVFGVILGTGTGGGVVVDRRVWGGRNAIAGEWGHNPLPRAAADELPGPPCYCGQTGCIETFLSGSGLARDHARYTGQRAEPAEIAARAAEGDRSALSTMARYEDRLARALSSVLNLLDPDVVVLGGGLSNIARLYENLPPLLERYAFSDRVDTPVVPPVHGDSSGVRGAAWLWDDEG